MIWFIALTLSNIFPIPIITSTEPINEQGNGNNIRNEQSGWIVKNDDYYRFRRRQPNTKNPFIPKISKEDLNIIRPTITKIELDIRFKKAIRTMETSNDLKLLENALLDITYYNENSYEYLVNIAQLFCQKSFEKYSDQEQMRILKETGVIFFFQKDVALHLRTTTGRLQKLWKLINPVGAGWPAKKFKKHINSLSSTESKDIRNKKINELKKYIQHINGLFNRAINKSRIKVNKETTYST